MKQMELLLVLVASIVFVKSQSEPDTCPPVDPNCHPWCIEYDVSHCRACRCKTGGLGSSGTSSGSSGSSSSFSSSGNSWESGVNSGMGTDYSGTGGMTSWSTNSKDSDNKVKYVIIKEKTDTSSKMMSPFSMSHGGNPFQSHGGISPFSPSSGRGGGLLPMNIPKPSGFQIPYGYTVQKVPVSQPGIPVYCVKNDIVCPSYCKKMDQQGCMTCPCAPAIMTYIKVLVPTSSVKPSEKTEYCLSTMSCMLSCKDGYKLGETGPDGCQKCSCITSAPTTTPIPNKEKKNCLSVVLCLLSCKDKNGYELGNTGPDGCPTCKCLKSGEKSKNESGNSWSTGNGQNMGISGNGQSFGNGQNTGGKIKDNLSQTKPGSSNILQSQTNGVGTGSSGNSGRSGNCFPMCQGGTMGGMTMTGTGSSTSMGSSQSGGSGSMTNSGGSGGSGCTGPFCEGGSGMGMGGSGSGMGGGGGMTMGGSGGSGVGGSGSCAGPFCAMMGGGGGAGGGSGGSSGGGGSGGKMTSPFMAAMGGGGGGSPSGAGMASPFGSGMRGPHGPLNPMSAPNQNEVKKTAYNEECFGPSCSAKAGKSRLAEGEDSCTALVECVLACDDGYILGAVGRDGCQTCSCKP